MMTPEEHRQAAEARGEKTGCPVCGEWNGYNFNGGYCYCEQHSGENRESHVEANQLRSHLSAETTRRVNAERASQAYCKEIGRLREELASVIRERDAAILKEQIGEGSHRRISDALIDLRSSIAPLHMESADRLRIIEEVAAVIGFKYPSECRDFLARRVRDAIENAKKETNDE